MPRVRRIGVKNIVLPLLPRQKAAIETAARAEYKSQQAFVIDRVRRAVAAKQPPGETPPRIPFGTPDRKSLYVEMPRLLYQEVAKLIQSDRPLDVAYYAVQAALRVNPEA